MRPAISNLSLQRSYCYTVLVLPPPLYSHESSSPFLSTTNAGGTLVGPPHARLDQGRSNIP